MFFAQASENGTQYDRYGAFWLGGVELLRTTTAEPTSEGIVWKLEKDVTAYSQLFLVAQSASLSIPNNIDSTYTGIPLVTITLTFYAASEEFPAPKNIPTVFAVTNGAGNWTALGVMAGSNLTYSTLLPYDDVVGVTLELMASPHGCEEFWYTNIDDDEAASKYGLCGGGVYRELQVFVDGFLAGATYPFPVMYTGGINPFLWRPLTGIMSFDIPAYSFDLTPFVLGNGQVHEITVKVLGGDSEGGVWYLDTTLLLYRDASAAPVSGSVTSHSDSGSNITTVTSLTSTGYGWNTSGTHAYHAKGQLIKASTSSAPVAMDAEVSGALHSWNTNALSDGASVETTNGALTAEHSDSLAAVLARSAARAEKSHSFYPYHIISSYKQDATTFDMRANVNMSYQRTNRYLSAPDGDYSVSWSNAILSNAAYNRTLDHSVVYVESDKAIGRYFVSDGQRGCYQRLATATEGYVVTDTQHGECSLPAGKYVCGYDLCSGGAAAFVQSPIGALAAVQEPLTLKPPATAGTAAKGRPSDRSRSTLVRNPLMGTKVLSKTV